MTEILMFDIYSEDSDGGRLSMLLKIIINPGFSAPVGVLDSDPQWIF